MLERFTKAARAVVERTVLLADTERSPQVRPTHLFAALLQDGSCLAVTVLEELGAPRERLLVALLEQRARFGEGLDVDDAEALASIGIDLVEVRRRMGELDQDEPGRGARRRRPRFSRPAKKVLELALREAVALRHDYIGTEHLLLGLVREGDAAVRETLAGSQVTPDLLRTAVADAVRRAG